METLSVTLEDRVIPLSIRRHRRARRISLRLSAARDAIVMTLPVRASVASGMEFFTSKAGWVLANVETDRNVAFADGITLPVLGEEYTIRRMEGRGVSALEEGELRVHCAPEFVARRVRDFLKKHLRDICLQRATFMSDTLGKTIREVKIRDTRSRWGSCSRRGTLTFHWQLVFAPDGVLDYLVAHEVAHLKEMNHGVRFWRTVAQLCPGYETQRRWLKREGHGLHRYGKA
jgi:predicted metal-dependent hydrolase